MTWPLWVGGALLLLGLLYWLFILTEGAYLGRRVVTWMYDVYAKRYDGIKQFDPRDESWFLGEPLTRALLEMPYPLVLDVATGTARLPLALLTQPKFGGRVVGLDLSRRMLRQAAAKTSSYHDRLTLLWQDADRLPFPDASFDAVSCLEALEFLPDPHTALAEMVRVLRSGGILLVSNRTGSGARWLPGRALDREVFTALLASLGLEAVRVNIWQMDYDIAWARKPGSAIHAAPATLPALLCCPHCGHGPLERQERAFGCALCGRRYPIASDGVIEMEES